MIDDELATTQLKRHEATQLQLVESVSDEPLPYNNVSRTKYLSPFRYPGGKTWLTPYLRQWVHYMQSIVPRPITLVEPFAGGASVGLMVANEKLADNVILVELDDYVAAVWHTIFDGDWQWLVDRITGFELSIENAEAELATRRRGTKQKAFQTILLNRINRGGVMAKGAGRLKEGENGKGIASRWYPGELGNRIQSMAGIRDRVQFIHEDGLKVIAARQSDDHSIFFIDPPYTAGGKRAGTRLYMHSEIDHEFLFNLVSGLHGRFLMTYDDTNEIRELAQMHMLQVRPISMKTTNHAYVRELLIGTDLSWLHLLKHNQRPSADTQQLEMELPK